MNFDRDPWLLTLLGKGVALCSALPSTRRPWGSKNSQPPLQRKIRVSVLAGVPWQRRSNYTALQGYDLLIHHPSGLFMTWFDTSTPGTKWLLLPRFQLRLNLTRLTSSPALLDELGPSSSSQIEREKKFYIASQMCFMNVSLEHLKIWLLPWSLLSGQRSQGTH